MENNDMTPKEGCKYCHVSAIGSCYGCVQKKYERSLERRAKFIAWILLGSAVLGILIRAFR